jgi:hypothetical protein
MGEVYKARDGKLGRDVAIKVLPEELSRDKKRSLRFEGEARLLAQLSHPNIATLHGLEDDEQTAAVEIEPVISPNGQWIAYSSNESGQHEVYVGPVSGTGKWQISTDGGREPLWSRDGTELFYWSGNKMYVAKVSAGNAFQHETPTELLEGVYSRATTRHQTYDVSDDGRFLMVKPEPVSPPRQLDIVLNWFEELERLVPTEM